MHLVFKEFVGYKNSKKVYLHLSEIFSELMGGSLMVQKEREKMERQAEEAKMYARQESSNTSLSNSTEQVAG